jgi:hypothetical protein
MKYSNGIYYSIGLPRVVTRFYKTLASSQFKINLVEFFSFANYSNNCEIILTRLVIQSKLSSDNFFYLYSNYVNTNTSSIERSCINIVFSSYKQSELLKNVYIFNAQKHIYVMRLIYESF